MQIDPIETFDLLEPHASSGAKGSQAVRRRAVLAGHSAPPSSVLELFDLRPAWHERAACRGTMSHGKSDWFPENKSEGGPVAARRRALKVCATCPVQDECREAGSKEFGVWSIGSTRTSRNGDRQRRYKEGRRNAQRSG